MAGVNKVILVGNLGSDPDVRSMPTGGSVARLSIATSESWRDKVSGEQKEKTEWHRVVFFGKRAETIGQYLKKGSKIYIEDSLRTSKWTDKDGADRYTTEIIADNFQFLDNKGSSDVFTQASPTISTENPKEQDPFDDDIPF